MKTKKILPPNPGLLAWALLLLAVAIVTDPGQCRATGTWTNISNYPTSYGNPGHMLLLSDGTVMVQQSQGASWYGLKPDNHGHYLNGSWSTLNSMHDTREFYSSDVLQDGRVFIAGGEYGSGKATAEIFNPQDNGGAGSWTYINPPISLLDPTVKSPALATNLEAFLDSDSIVIANGNVLITPVGPDTTNGTLIYSSVSNSWVAGPLLRQDYLDEATVVKLPDDSIVTIDLFVSGGDNTAERYIPSLNAWISEANTPVAVFAAVDSETGPAFLMPDGRAFFLGGSGHTVFYTPTGDTNNGHWSQGPDLPFYSGPFVYSSSKAPGGYVSTNYNGLLTAQDTPAAMMNNGKILCQFACNTYHTENWFYEYDPATTNFVAAPCPTNATPGTSFIPASNISDETSMLDLPDGSVLYNDTASLYIYTPDGTPLPDGKPVISSVSWNADGSLHLTGKLFNGISQGASYGDDYQQDSNYPLVRFTDGGGNVSYGRTYNWSSTGVQTGNKIVSTECAVPANASPGAYSLQVVANGNASDPVGFFGPVWVDFNYTGSVQNGNLATPYKTLAQGTSAVANGGTVAINGGVQPSLSPETMAISKPMTIISVSGPSTIGQ